jgi:predicted RNA binding protein with dsRBD fold (UPF0201 family)
MVGKLKIYENVDTCEQCIQSSCNKTHVVLMMNKHASQLSVSHIHELSQMSAIHVYVMDRKENLIPR